MIRYLLAALAGALYFLGWAGFDLWPLAFVAFVPALGALDPQHEAEPLTLKRVVGLGFVFGFVMNVGGYYWVASTLQVFSGFSYPWCVLFSSVFWAFQGLSLSVFALVYRALRKRGATNTVAAPVAISVAEWLYPELFPHYFGGSLHDFPLAIQVADLGGPLLVSALLVVANVGFYELWLMTRQKSRQRMLLVPTALWALTLAYGAYRIHEVDERAARADKIHVGLVQANMGLIEKRKNPRESLRRHIEQSVALERQGVDLLVWPESAFSWWLPSSVKNVQKAVLGGEIHTPTLFGGISKRKRDDGRLHMFNTAFMAEADGTLTGTYDKTFLLAFGEYIPFGETFPQLYEISRNSGRFSSGDHVRPLSLGEYRLSTLICYEDILPGFVAHSVREAKPHLFVNITNDAWFGDTHAPWEHLALAKFRAVEHHRALVRATNSGVTTAIDPVGRTITVGRVFERESLRAEVPMMQGDSPYLTLRDFPGYLSVLVLLVYLARTFRRSKP